jgi:hypothetical protein
VRTQCPVCLTHPSEQAWRCAEHDVHCVEAAELRNRARAPYLGWTLLDRYILVGWLGGAVYRSFDTKLRRTVALKLLPAQRLEGADARIRFQRDAQTLAGLDHPGAAHLLDFGAVPDGPLRGHGYLVFARVGGLGLDRRLELGPLSPETARTLSAALTDLIETAHGQGIVHGDVRPANIRLTPHPVLLGFDVAQSEVTAAADTAALAQIFEVASDTPVAPVAARPRPVQPVAVAVVADATPTPSAPRRRSLVWVAAALLGIAAAVTAVVLSQETPAPEALVDDVVRVQVPMGP